MSTAISSRQPRDKLPETSSGQAGQAGNGQVTIIERLGFTASCLLRAACCAKGEARKGIKTEEQNTAA
jgi:hypothetical protein